MPENLPALSEQVIHAILDAETIALCALGFEQTPDTKLAESYRHRAAEDAVALTARLAAIQAEMDACERSLERAVRREGRAEPVECGGKSAATAHRLALDWAADIGLAVWVGMGRSDVAEELLKTPVNHAILPTLANYAESWAAIVPVVMRRAKGLNRERLVALVRSESTLLEEEQAAAFERFDGGIRLGDKRVLFEPKLGDIAWMALEYYQRGEPIPRAMLMQAGDYEPTDKDSFRVTLSKTKKRLEVGGFLLENDPNNDGCMRLSPCPNSGNKRAADTVNETVNKS